MFKVVSVAMKVTFPSDGQGGLFLRLSNDFATAASMRGDILDTLSIYDCSRQTYRSQDVVRVL